MHDHEGKTFRAIADELGTSKSTVHRLLRMAGDAPPLPTPAAVVGERVRQLFAREACIVNGCHGCGTCRGRAARDLSGVPGTIIEGHDDCPDDCDMCGPRPVYPLARRYGHLKACWKPGSENWTEEQLDIYDRWQRTYPRPGPEPDFNPRAGP